MGDYDDLQRFKDKTRTQHLEFKELSVQTTSRKRGDWTILDQLSPPTGKDITLAVGGSVSQVVPRPVSADAFVPLEISPIRGGASKGGVHESSETSIMQSVSSQMMLQDEPEVVPAPTTVSVAKPEPISSVGTVQTEAASPAFSGQPSSASRMQAVNYSRLFAPKPTEIPGKEEKEEKNQPLKSLLERIASCR
ncbi:cellulose biosynthesis protein BcsO [Scandinavium sp. H11S7]|uniref:Cellulose biosynthesis protein BcsO n=1 Tax=Scandinavium hiltneri TaxID=2926519 RepID=A0ABT2EAD9_9ENTR|nr:cellulose biosynthesis protein BcsO [Scandinavium hiltneri]MCS2163920.1 cellulose biosynthesis protein BcsO [Scandinavium hiltneri]